MHDTVVKPRIFLSYAREDLERVEKLYLQLVSAGFKPWMDTKDILPGEKWEQSIQKAIRASNFFIACLSNNSVYKRGSIQREIKYALDFLQGMLDSDIYMIPARLEDCEVPENLRHLHWVDLYKETGWRQLVRAIQKGMELRAQTSRTEPLRPSIYDGIASELEAMEGMERLVHRPKYKAITDELDQLLAGVGPSSSVGEEMTTPEQQQFAIAVLTQAVTFLFDEARKILAERRQRRQEMDEPDDTVALPPDVAESKKERILVLEPTNFDEERQKEINHLLELIKIQLDHRRKAEIKIGKLGGILFVPPNVRAELEYAEDEVLRHTQQLKKLMEQVYSQPIYIDGLE